MREHPGEDANAPLDHPTIISGYDHRALGVKPGRSKRDIAAPIIPSAGCPMGCNFCPTSAFFGGKGKFVNFFDSGRELFDVMCRLEVDTGAKSFFVMDENFLLQKPRAMSLLALMRRENKPWTLYVFSSANAIRKYTMEELVALGVSWIWMGLESPKSSYSKLAGTDTIQLTRELRQHGIKLLGSTIVGLEHHTPANIDSEIDHAIRHDTDFHQFMLYTPVPGTPFYAQMQEEGRLLPDIDLADIHGQWKFTFEHAAIAREESKRLPDEAFRRDFLVNGPSLYRICRTTLDGWLRYKKHPELRIRARFERECKSLQSMYAAMLWTMEHYFRRVNAEVASRIRQVRRDVQHEFGFKLTANLLGPFLLWTSRREEARLAAGATYEPATVIERRNWA